MSTRKRDSELSFFIPPKKIPVFEMDYLWWALGYDTTAKGPAAAAAAVLHPVEPMGSMRSITVPPEQQQQPAVELEPEPSPTPPTEKEMEEMKEVVLSNPQLSRGHSLPPTSNPAYSQLISRS